MPLRKFKSLLTTLAPISDKEWEDVKHLFHLKTIAKHDYFVKKGNVSQELGLVINGIMRSFFIVDNKEVTTFFQFPENFTVAMHSFLEQKPADESIQAIETTDLIVIKREDLYKLYGNNWKWQQVGRVLTEKNYINLENRMLVLQSKTALDKYRNLLKTNPNILKYVPLQYVSSYLGITPETLSRVRRKV